MAASKHHNLSVLLLKDGFRTFDQAVKPDARTKRIKVEAASREIGELYLRYSVPKRPRWSSFFESVIDGANIVPTTSAGAALLIETGGRIFAITFGQGRYLLQTDSWVERFGLKVALNSIGKDKIRSIDKTTFDAISRQSKEQASKETEAREFGLDVEQDLLRAVTGVPKSPVIGKKIYGMDSLSVSTDIKIERIGDWLGRIYDKYTDDSYKKDFPWVDHISEVKDKSAVAELDGLLISSIASGNIDRIWMAVPEIIEWDQVGGFCYKLGSRSAEYQDVHLQDFLGSLTESERGGISKETLTKKHVRCIHTDGHLMQEWQVYKCLHCEMLRGTDTFLLSNGRWYIVASEFVASVNQSYREIPNYQCDLPKYNDDSEGNYNDRVCKQMAGRFALMDKKNIVYGGGHSQIEFCDLLSVNRDIIHVKRYGSSSVLSHLFAQGRLSGELFQMEQGFREKVAKMLPQGFHINNPLERPKTDDYQVVYAIISDVPGELEVPFFSKLNLKNSARNLRGLGYRVAKLKIEVDESRAKLTKFRTRRKQK